MREPARHLRLLAAALLLGCAHREARVSTWTVYAGPDAVLTMRDEPGALTSTAPPPPSGAPTHPWISAAALDAAHEAALRDLLVASTDPADFRARLRAAGYRVVAE